MAVRSPSAATSPTPYRRRRPERTLLYRTVRDAPYDLARPPARGPR